MTGWKVLTTCQNSVPAALKEPRPAYPWLESCGIVEQDSPCWETLCPFILMVNDVLKHLPCSGGLPWKMRAMVEEAVPRRSLSRLSDPMSRPDLRPPRLCCECLMPVRCDNESHEHCVCMCDPEKEEIALFAD